MRRLKDQGKISGQDTWAAAVAAGYTLGTDLTKVTDIEDLLPIVNAKPDAELLSDLDATVAWAGSQGGDTARLGIIGFCRGGRTVWEYAAHSGALKAALAENKQTAEFKIYPEAPHGFHADYRGSYRKEAAEDAWAQAQAWFRKYGVLS